MRRLRIAFVTNEFVTDLPDAGGLGNYLNRMSQTLCASGHEVDIITLTDGMPRTQDHHGVRVISRRDGSLLPKRINRHLGKYLPQFHIGDLQRSRRGAKALARVFHRLHRQRPYDLVQSTNCGLSGFDLQVNPPTPHIMRMSSARDLWLSTDQKINDETRVEYEQVCELERECISRVDLAYAPSRFVADYFQQQHGVEVQVLRPPACIEVQPASQPPVTLPSRFLFHFGKLMRRKGTDVLAEALPIAWKSAPGLTVVMAGRLSSRNRMEGYRQLWGERSNQVVWLGALEKPQLYSVLSRSICSVLPSLVDNLPNTVIESLMFGIPVIGSRGASIDELVEDERSGQLVPLGSATELAAAMVRAWRGESPWLGNGFIKPAILDEMEPQRAADNLIHLALLAPVDKQHTRRAA